MREPGVEKVKDLPAGRKTVAVRTRRRPSSLDAGGVLHCAEEDCGASEAGKSDVPRVGRDGRELSN